MARGANIRTICGTRLYNYAFYFGHTIYRFLVSFCSLLFLKVSSFIDLFDLVPIFFFSFAITTETIQFFSITVIQHLNHTGQKCLQHFKTQVSRMFTASI